MAELDARRAEVLGNAARTIQRQIRTYIARKEFISLRKAAIRMQSYWRRMVSSTLSKLPARLIVFCFFIYLFIIILNHC